MKKSGIGLLAALLAFAVWAEEATLAPDEFVYEVRRGDTLSRLAHTLLDNPQRWADVAAYNHLPDANLIRPGQRLHIKNPWLKGRAGQVTVEAISGAPQANGRALQAGQQLGAGVELLTPADAALKLRLPDGSTVAMMPGTRLRVEQIEQKPGNVFVSLFRLVNGQVDAFKRKYAAGQADMRIATQKATLGVRGTHFRMRDDGQRVFAEIEQGQVGFEAARTPMVLALAGGEGSVADGEHAAEVIPLLPPPTLNVAASYATPYVQLPLPPQAGATQFVGELARNEDFSDRLVSVRGKGRLLDLGELENGDYWLRLRAVDQHGLQGMEAKVSFKVDAPPRKFRMTKVYVTPSTLQLRWVGRKEGVGYQVQMSASQEFDTLLLDTRTSDNQVEVARPRPGYYYMRVRQIFPGGVVDSWDIPMMFESPR
ncbi:MAG: hypothetical protein Fur0040_05080 [Sideroxydans sp.]